MAKFESGTRHARKVTLGVSGGIAAYKALDLLRALQQANLDPHVVMTRSATRFVTPLTFASISGHRVMTGLWSKPEDTGQHATPEAAIDHIAEAQTTQMLIVAPATANTLAKFAGGTANDFLSALYLATKAPVLLAPAMNVNMWEHPATQANLKLLEQRGATVVPPGSGYLACGMTGSGRLAETSVVLEAVLKLLDRRQDLAGETVLITSGGTREAIDPVRFLGNRSSGKTGHALARAALDRGARVILVTAPTAVEAPAGCEVVPVTSAAEMHRAVMLHLPRATIVIGAAAVADFRPLTVATEKLRRNGPISLELEPTEDILAAVARQRLAGTLLVAFAAETDSERALDNARAKLLRKGANAIVLNDVSRPGLGFDSDSNAATLITRDASLEFAPMSKLALAGLLLDEIARLRMRCAASASR
jgi:phosphopantothenoylcysteine decarboxylase/phosphopantothenate--cysteine ligase